ncbi:unnamed protein product [Oikopleura dioica]|uniref:peptidylamidoglycolate lyase n=1 Tax=Oikopleura dioica TaxID=34765 RepID=E4X388_OIKDI|nr:unnamed protein product [Oikopleura dioica]
MKGATTNHDDEYLTTSIPVDLAFGLNDLSEEVFVNQIKVQTDGKVHHIIVKGCSDIIHKIQELDYTNKFGIFPETILFSWALDAGPLVLPENSSIRLGGQSDINSINIEAHYKEKFEGSDDLTGLVVQTSTQPPKKLIGIYLLGSSYFSLPVGKQTNVNVGCEYEFDEPIEVFAFRTHAHTNGQVITGYREPEGWHMIGKGNPQWPHAFYSRVGGSITIQKGDLVHASCTFFNKNNFEVFIGKDRDNEMCNLYLMYAIPFHPGPLNTPSCWKMNGPAPDDIPDTLTDMTPYPGYAGEDSIKAIASGVKKPDVPMEMKMHHHGADDRDEERDLDELKSPIDHLKNLPQSETLLSIDYQPDWKINFTDLGEVAGVDSDYDGTVWVFHRGDYSWDAKAYIGFSDVIAYKKPTSIACVLQVDRETGNVLRKFGEDTFYMPHGITVTKDAIWVTDTGTHMIYKFSKKGDLLKTIGELKIPGYGDYQFCKPTDVAVDESTGEFYVADGYCNSRIVHFTSDYKFIAEYGQGSQRFRSNAEGYFDIVHDISIGPGSDLFVSDRQNGRVQVFDRDSRKFVKMFQNDRIGDAIYASVWSPQLASLFLINNWPTYTGKEQKGFSLYANGTLEKSYVPKDPLETAHDITLSKDGTCLFIAELRPHKVHMFHLNTKEKEQHLFSKIASEKVMTVVKDKPEAFSGIFIITSFLVIMCTFLVVRKRKKADKRVFVYRPLLQNADDTDEEEEMSIFERKNVL